MYRLMINRGAEWLTADLMPDERPAVTFQVNDIAELKDQNVDCSQRLTLPMTGNNARIFGYVNSPAVRMDSVYDYMPCRLYYGMYSLMGRGALLSVLQAKDDSIEVLIVAGVSDVFDELDGVDLSAVDDTEISPVLPVHPDISVPDNPNVTFPVMYTGYGDETTRTLDPASNAYRLPMPAVWLCRNGGDGRRYGLLPFLARQIGYTVEVQDSNGFAPDMLIVPADRKRTVENGEVLRVLDFRYFSTSPSDQFGNKALYFEEMRSGVRLHTGQSLGYIQREVSLRLSVSFTVTTLDYIEYATCYYSYKIGGKKSDYITIYTSSWDDETRTYTRDFIIEALPSDIISMEIYIHYNRGEHEAERLLANGRVKIETIVKPDIDYAFPGTVMPICRNLKWKSATDAFKAVCQLLGLIVDVDYGTKKITLTNMSRLTQNRDRARDWSDRLINGGIVREFTVGEYARENTISLKPDRDGFTDSGVLTCGNRTLEKRKELFTIDFESGEGAKVKFYGKDEDGKAAYKALSAPHAGGYSLSTRQFAHIMANGMIKVLYREVQDMLTRPLTVTADFLLDTADVADFDHFTPVYLRQFGAYFYVNKISNFVAGEVTEVELIKLNT